MVPEYLSEHCELSVSSERCFTLGKKKGAGLTGTPFLTINHALDGEGTITFEPDC